MKHGQCDTLDRNGVDTGRNGYHSTFAAAYTVRARRGAPVSAPCSWKEIERGEVEPASFTVRNILERVQKIGDTTYFHLRLENPTDIAVNPGIIINGAMERANSTQIGWSAAMVPFASNAVPPLRTASARSAKRSVSMASCRNPTAEVRFTGDLRIRSSR